MTEDPYDILGVPRTATSDEIKKAYRKKARENHPDLNPDDPEAEERLKKINEAYDRITNPEKYAREDARRYRSPYNPTYTGYGTPGGNPFGGAGPGSPSAVPAPAIPTVGVRPAAGTSTSGWKSTGRTCSTPGTRPPRCRGRRCRPPIRPSCARRCCSSTAATTKRPSRCSRPCPSRSARPAGTI